MSLTSFKKKKICEVLMILEKSFWEMGFDPPSHPSKKVWHSPSIC